MLGDLGRIYAEQQKFPEALTEFKRAAALRDDFEPAYTSMGLIYEVQGKPDEAIEAYKKAVAEPRAVVRLSGFGECLPYFENRVEIDPSGQVDVFGIPILKITMKWGDNERAMVKDMAESGAQILEAAGAKNVEPYAVPDRIPGFGIHEIGVARMGSDPKKSVLNGYQQAHDVRSLFVMDGAGFTSGACQNPTLTIMALAVRSSDYLLEQMKRGEL